MNSRNEKAEFATVTTEENNSPDHKNRMHNTRIFKTNFDKSRIILGVPRDFLYPRVQPPVTPQKSTVHFVNST